MASLMFFLESLIALLFCLLMWFLYFLRHRRGYPKSWPIVGMFLEMFLQMHRLHDKSVELLELCACTFSFTGPWFTNMEIVFTVDPSNVQYVMSTNFSNYPKGRQFQEFFDILGGGVFNVDSDSWRTQRKVAVAYLTDKRFFKYLLKITAEKIEKGLIPVLDNASKTGSAVDLQDLFQRFGNDATWILVAGHDPMSLSPALPEVQILKALDDIEETIFHRYITPESIWKFQRWLGVGQEGKHKEAWKVLDKFVFDYLASKREILKKETKSEDENEQVTDLLSSYMKENVDDKFLRDTIINFLVAGRESSSATLTWFTWLVTTKPQVKDRIRKELKTIIPKNKDEKCLSFDVEELNKLVYLHAALYETLRLYPTVPFQGKSPAQSDVLPSGHKVYPNTKILFPRYAMGRMTRIWGKDCREFKPERWITDNGELKNESSYKFFAFNAGPRICPGKEMSFLQLKSLAAVILYYYDVHVVEGHPVVPSNSVILHMKDGFMVTLTKRSV